MTMNELMNQTVEINLDNNVSTNTLDWRRGYIWGDFAETKHTVDQSDIEKALEDCRSLVKKLTARVTALEELCKNFKRVLDIKTDRDLMKFLEDFGVE